MIGKYFVLLVTVAVAAAVQPVPVTIYYETLCIDSMNFFTKEFTPTWDALKNYIDVKLVPYGKTKMIPVNPAPGQNQTFDCHHGANECVGNKFQACLLSPTYGYGLDNQISFINCLMTDATKEKKYEETTLECKKKIPQIDVTLLNVCATSAMGDTLLAENGRKTRMVQNGDLTSVPTIVFNRFDAAESKEAETSFRKALCKRITDSPKPKACEGSGAPITTVGLITFLTAGLFVRLL